MPIRFFCGGCNQKYKFNEKLAGRTIKCGGCGALLVIPEPAAESSSSPPPISPALLSQLGSTEIRDSRAVALGGVATFDLSQDLAAEIEDAEQPLEPEPQIGLFGRLFGESGGLWLVSGSIVLLLAGIIGVFALLSSRWETADDTDSKTKDVATYRTRESQSPKASLAAGAKPSATGSASPASAVKGAFENDGVRRTEQLRSGTARQAPSATADDATDDAIPLRGEPITIAQDTALETTDGRIKAVPAGTGATFLQFDGGRVLVRVELQVDTFTEGFIPFKTLDLGSKRVLPDDSAAMRALQEAGVQWLKSPSHGLVTTIQGDFVMTDELMQQVGKLPNVETLRLSSSKVGDGGLAHVRNLRRLRDLVLNETRVTSDGIAHLAEFDRLVRLDLEKTGVDDQALVHLKQLPRLKYLDVRRTGVTTKAVKELRAALPGLLVRF